MVTSSNYPMMGRRIEYNQSDMILDFKRFPQNQQSKRESFSSLKKIKWERVKEKDNKKIVCIGIKDIDILLISIFCILEKFPLVVETVDTRTNK